jgi:hypothetical protein
LFQLSSESALQQQHGLHGNSFGNHPAQLDYQASHFLCLFDLQVMFAKYSTAEFD